MEVFCDFRKSLIFLADTTEPTLSAQYSVNRSRKKKIPYPETPYDIFVQNRVIDVLEIIVDNMVLKLKIYQTGKPAVFHVFQQRFIIVSQIVKNKKFRI